MRKILYGIIGWFGFLTLLLTATGSFDETVQLAVDSSNPHEESVALSKESQNSALLKEDVEEAFVTVGSIDTSNPNGAYYYHGTTSDNCSKVTVEAENSKSGLYDSYRLTDYEYGDTSFYYGIRSDWDNLDEGTMEYTFTATCDGDQEPSTEASYTYTKPATQSTNTSSSSGASYSQSTSTGVDYYTNVDGNTIQSPTYYPSIPAGATAKCRDDTYSFSQHRNGTCSHHGGVATWY